MKVDLSQAKPGDVVVLRHGGMIPIGRIERHEVDGGGICHSLFVGGDYSEHIGNFSQNGINERHPYEGAYCSIIEVLPWAAKKVPS